MCLRMCVTGSESVIKFNNNNNNRIYDPTTLTLTFH